MLKVPNAEIASSSDDFAAKTMFWVHVRRQIQVQALVARENLK